MLLSSRLGSSKAATAAKQQRQQRQQRQRWAKRALLLAIGKQTGLGRALMPALRYVDRCESAINVFLVHAHEFEEWTVASLGDIVGL